MKKNEVIKEANIGSSVELSNVELLVIKTKWEKINDIFKTTNKFKYDQELQLNLVHFNSFIEKLCGEVITLKDVEEELFSSEPITEESLAELVKVSTAGSFDGDMSDKERASRIIEKM